MSNMSKKQQSQHASDQLVRVTVIGAVVDGLLGLLKVVVGLVGHSAALVADGIHSFSDLISDTFVVWVGKVAYSQADSEHPYGHRRFETLGSMLLGASLILVAGAIAWEGGRHLWQQWWLQIAPQPVSVWVLWVALLSVIAKEWIYRLTSKVGQEIGSSLLEANAWHSRSDAISSLMVLVGLVLSYMGLFWLDRVMAIIVGFYIAYIGWTLLNSGAGELVDTRGLSQAETEAVIAHILSIPGVLGVHDFRSRRMGGEVLIDTHVEVSKTISVSEGHQLGELAVERICHHYPAVREATLHIDPQGIHTLNAVWPTREEVVAQLLAVPIEEEMSLRCFLNPERLELHYAPEGVTVECYYSMSALVEKMGQASIVWEALKKREQGWCRAVRQCQWPWLLDIKVFYF